MDHDDSSGNFWWRWLLAWSVFFALFGVATAWLGSLPPAAIWEQWVANHFFGGSMPPDAQTLYDFMRGPLGGTMAGSYVLQVFIVVFALRRGESWAWWSIAAATTLWFIVDSAVSALHGAWFNVLMINGFALGVTLAGLFGFRATAPIRPFRAGARQPGSKG